MRKLCAFAGRELWLRNLELLAHVVVLRVDAHMQGPVALAQVEEAVKPPDATVPCHGGKAELVTFADPVLVPDLEHQLLVFPDHDRHRPMVPDGVLAVPDDLGPEHLLASGPANDVWVAHPKEVCVPQFLGREHGHAQGHVAGWIQRRSALHLHVQPSRPVVQVQGAVEAIQACFPGEIAIAQRFFPLLLILHLEVQLHLARNHPLLGPVVPLRVGVARDRVGAEGLPLGLAADHEELGGLVGTYQVFNSLHPNRDPRVR
mmetsp:Transcript_88476/g.263894  ORF Transcript_88476/g.263894 Transcript_88476/m.263894 type:complete len:260 (-) Transcript_88476:1419-2198(-)